MLGNNNFNPVKLQVHNVIIIRIVYIALLDDQRWKNVEEQYYNVTTDFGPFFSATSV